MTARNCSAQSPDFSVLCRAIAHNSLFMCNTYISIYLINQQKNIYAAARKLLGFIRADERTKHPDSRAENIYHNIIKRFALFHDKSRRKKARKSVPANF